MYTILKGTHGNTHQQSLCCCAHPVGSSQSSDPYSNKPDIQIWMLKAITQTTHTDHLPPCLGIFDQPETSSCSPNAMKDWE